jgi:hypothetical protein
MGCSERMDNSHYLDIFFLSEEMPSFENKKGPGDSWLRHHKSGSQ